MRRDLNAPAQRKAPRDDAEAHSLIAGEAQSTVETRRWVLQGAVQGKGIRPRLARLAARCRLNGELSNTLAGVEMLLSGSAGRLDQFANAMLHEFGSKVCLRALPQGERMLPSEMGVRIVAGAEPANTAPATPIPLDQRVCDECLAEVGCSDDRRFDYPLVTCAECGPRYSILRAMPFERDQTEMAAFAMCPACDLEYRSPSDRRFHAQTIACPVCGPVVWLSAGDGRSAAHHREAVGLAIEAVRRGEIIALRGIGGYQLLCDATSSYAVRRLRERKGRRAKPLAVLVEDLDHAQQWVQLTAAETRELASPANPILIAKQRSGTALAAELNPGLTLLGVMLPTTALHWRLAQGVGKPLVCTSGNREGEPLVDAVDAAERELAGIADLWLHHDRPITRPLDDSVVRVIADRPVTIRLARGLAPLTLDLPPASPSLALGGHLKQACAWSNGSQSVLGPHQGDLDGLAVRARVVEHLRDVQALYRFHPSVVLHDQHPDYVTTRFAESPTLWHLNPEVVRVTQGCQHHVAHLAAGLAQHGWLQEPALGIVWDGAGWGPDGTLWGGEWLLWEPGRGTRRVARLRPFALPGGETAVRQPWRVMLSLMSQCLDPRECARAMAQLPNSALAEALLKILANRQARPLLTSSVGRLWDGLACAVLGVTIAEYEAQPAVRLESCATMCEVEPYPFAVQHRSPGFWEVDWRPAVRAAITDLENDQPVGWVSSRLHRGLAAAALEVAAHFPGLPVVLAGGVMQNRIMVEQIVAQAAPSLRLGLPGRIPCNDGGLAAGQLAWSAWTR